jgi:hypothetical protein
LHIETIAQVISDAVLRCTARPHRQHVAHSRRCRSWSRKPRRSECRAGRRRQAARRAVPAHAGLPGAAGPAHAARPAAGRVECDADTRIVRLVVDSRNQVWARSQLRRGVIDGARRARSALGRDVVTSPVPAGTWCGRPSAGGLDPSWGLVVDRGWSLSWTWCHRPRAVPAGTWCGRPRTVPAGTRGRRVGTAVRPTWNGAHRDRHNSIAHVGRYASDAL